MPGILLTGGASRRMGRDKATLVVDGETLALRAARVLQSVCDPVVEVGPAVTTLPAVREEPAGAGPLAALVAGADAVAPNGPVLLLACDLPRVDAPLLRLLADWPGDASVVPIADGRPQFVCSRVGAAGVEAARRALASGVTALAAAFDVDCEHIDEPTWRRVAPADAFRDLDTPEDVAGIGTVAP
jgi:molybdopterin-guanine dinucleotide biosynthesis protein A